jgi:type II restriction enzyme
MLIMTASNLVKAISKLPKNQSYNYIAKKTTTKVIVADIQIPEGPITIKRYDPNSGKGLADASRDTISTQMIWRVANAIRPNIPVNFDRLLGASYNTRSALETLLAYTPEFYFCYPGRIESISASTKIKAGHKHLIWLPNKPHKQGVIEEIKTDIVISEIPNAEAVYESLVLPEKEPEQGFDFEMARRHAMIQVALVKIGQQLGFRTWVAHNDKGIVYENKKLGEMDGVITRLDSERLLSAFPEAVHAARLIDCVWFRNAKFMPAVIEIEHSTGVTSGLTRMQGFQQAIPAIQNVRWVIAAPDEDRDKVIRECNRPQFKSLNAQFFPYSAVEELYSLCQRRKLKGLNDEFLDCFMESTLQTLPNPN